MGDNNSASTVGELWELFELMYFVHLTQSLTQSKLVMLATRDHPGAWYRCIDQGYGL